MTNPLRLALRLVMPALMGFALGCGGGGSSAPPAPSPTPAPTPGGQVGSLAVNIPGIDATGAPVSLQDYKGSVIILDVSAEWCPPCNADAVPLENLYQKYKAQGLKVVTCLSQDRSGNHAAQSVLANWVAKGLTYRVMNDTSASTPNAGVAESTYVNVTNAFPTIVIIDKAFVIQYVQGGYSPAAVEAKLTTLLAQ